MNNELRGVSSPLEQPSPLRCLPGASPGVRAPAPRFTFENYLQSDELRGFNDIYSAYSPLLAALSPPVLHHAAFTPLLQADSGSESPGRSYKLSIIKVGAPGKRRSNYFVPIIAFLTDFFGQRPCAIDDSFEVPQLHVILAVLRRKLGAKAAARSERKEEILAELRSYAALHRPFTHKRTEENNKFVFKHAVKLLKKELADAAPAPLTAAELDAAFVRRYFREAQAGEAADAQTFRRVKTYSSLSLATLRAIFRNPALAAELTRVLSDPSVEKSALVSGYAAALHKKVVKIFRKWNKKLAAAHSVAEVVAELIDYFETSSQCKLPWTVKEIVTAVQCFCESVLVEAGGKGLG